MDKNVNRTCVCYNMVCYTASMAGTSTNNLFVIEETKTPRILKNVRSLPVTYEAYKRAWVTKNTKMGQ